MVLLENKHPLCHLIGEVHNYVTECVTLLCTVSLCDKIMMSLDFYFFVGEHFTKGFLSLCTAV